MVKVLDEENVTDWRDILAPRTENSRNKNMHTNATCGKQPKLLYHILKQSSVIDRCSTHEPWSMCMTACSGWLVVADGEFRGRRE